MMLVPLCFYTWCGGPEMPKHVACMEKHCCIIRCLTVCLLKVNNVLLLNARVLVCVSGRRLSDAATTPCTEYQEMCSPAYLYVSGYLSRTRYGLEVQ
jgi:hypothetical protein